MKHSFLLESTSEGKKKVSVYSLFLGHGVVLGSPPLCWRAHAGTLRETQERGWQTGSSPSSYERTDDHSKYCHLNTPRKLLPAKERQEDTAVTQSSVFTEASPALWRRAGRSLPSRHTQGRGRKPQANQAVEKQRVKARHF